MRRSAWIGLALVAALATSTRREWTRRPPATAVTSPEPQGAIRDSALIESFSSERLHGYVLNATGDAVAGAEVAILPPPGRCCARDVVVRTSTDESGRFEFTHAPAGEVRLLARRGIAGAASATVSTPGPHYLTFERELWLEGAIRDTAGRPLVAEVMARVRLRACATFSPVTVSSRSDETGAFRIGPIAPETTIILEARARGFRPVRQGPVQVGSYQSLTLVPGETLSGIARSTDGSPLAGATVTAHQGDGFTFETITGSDGAFELTGLAARPARVIARREGFATATRDVEVAASITLSLDPEWLIEGRVEPARAGLVAVVDRGGERHRFPIDADGTFRIRGAGRVRLEIDGTSTWIEPGTKEILIRLP